MAHHAADHSHDHHHGPSGSARGDALKIGAFLILLFLISAGANYLFAEETLYNWAQTRQNAEAAQDIAPGPGDQIMPHRHTQKPAHKKPAPADDGDGQ